MVKMVLFAASRDQLNYFQKLKSKMGSDVTVWWYKSLNWPDFSVRVPKNEIVQQVNILQTRKQNSRKGLGKSKLYWGLLRRVWFVQASWLFYCYVGKLKRVPAPWIGVWNGKKFRQAILVLAVKAVGKKVIYFETGPLPGYSAIDPEGVDYYSALPRKSVFYQQYACGDKSVLELPASTKIDDLPEAFIFIPFQVVEDSNIYLHSPWIKDMRQLYAELELLSLRYPNLRFVLKVHPACPENYDDLKEKTLSTCGRIQFVDNWSTQDLVKQAQAVLTINSTVGMEALMARKRLIVLGQAIYGFEPLVKIADSSSKLQEIIETLEAWVLDVGLINQYLCFLKNEYAVCGDAMNSPDTLHWQAMQNKINLVMDDQAYEAIGLGSVFSFKGEK